MSQENVELVRSLQDDWNRGDRTVDADRIHPDLEFLPRRAATEGVYRGLAGLERFFADTLEVFEKFELQHEYADLGERVLGWGHIHVRARGSGIETDIESGGVFEFRDGKVVRWEDFGSKDKAVEAVGLSKTSASPRGRRLAGRPRGS
jgi:ketosteroid isomerase-like protein